MIAPGYLKNRPDAEAAARVQQAAKENLKWLCKEILGMKDWSENKSLHDSLARFLKRPSKFKLLLIPRDHLKSSIVTKAWSIQQLLANPDLRILIANNTWDNARKFLRSIQAYLAPGSVLSRLFGSFVSNQWNQDEITIRQRTQILDAPSIATTGLEKEQTSQHYDLIVADDLVARENISTPEQREKVKDYIRSLYALLEPEARLVVVGTRWSQDDAYGDLIEEGVFDVMQLGAYADEEKTKVMFPEKFTLEKLQALRKSLGPYLFSCWYMNNPIAPEAADFKKAWVHFYDPCTPHPKILYLMADPAESLSRDADFSAGTLSGKFASGKIRVVDYFRKRCVPSELVDEIFKMVRKWRDAGHYVEAGVEAFTYENLKTDLETRMRKEDFFFRVEKIKKMRGPHGEKGYVKEARIRGMQPLFEQGLIEIREDMQDLEDELLAFPRGKWDDLIDTLSMAIEKLVPSSEGSQARKEIPGSMGWWVKHHLKTPQLSLYEKFMEDLA